MSVYMPTFFYWLLIICLILFAYLARRSWLTAAGLALFFLPSFQIRFTLGRIPSTALEVLLLVLLAAWLIELWQKKTWRAAFLNNPFFWPALLFLLAATLAIFPAPDLRAALGYWKAYAVEPVLFFFALADQLRDQKKLEKILLWLGASVMVISLFAIYQKFTAFLIPPGEWSKPGTRRVTSFFNSPNAITLYIVPLAIIYFGWLLQRWQDKKWLLNRAEVILTSWQILLLAATVATAIFAKSRGSWLGGIVGILFILFFGWSKKYTSALAAAGLLGIFSLSKIRQSLLPILTFKIMSGSIRLTMYKQALLWLKPKWFSGLGWGGFKYYYAIFTKPRGLEPFIYPHTLLLNFWSELGLPGVCATTYLLYSFFRRGYLNFKSHPQPWLLLGILAAMVETLVHGLVDVPYFKNDLAIIFWLLPVLLLALTTKPAPESL
jgi:O-antigen ligase